jgi:aminoglycoside phosphotransferase (APT) family kinase protein
VSATVPTSLSFDQSTIARVRERLQDIAPQFADVRAATQLKGGQSNPTFRLETAAGPVVLRMRPPGVGPWAHDVRREHRVLTALRDTDVPVPEVFAYCEDASVAGGEFYLMEYVAGRIIDDCRMPGFAPDERALAYESFVRAFARLHAVDFTAVGLADFGKPEQYLERQLRLHARKFAEYQPEGDPDMAWLVEHLPRHLPARTRPSIVHNDIRMGNVVLHPTEPRVIAILDWEMATLGDMFADAALITLPYTLPVGNPQGTFRGFDTAAAGIPSVESLLATYCEALGLAEFENHAFMTAFDLFRYASVYAGVADRARKGLAVSTDAHEYAAVIGPTARAAREVAEAALGPAPQS